MLLGAVIASGVRAIRKREAHVPEPYEGESAVRLGWFLIALGALFMLGVMFDISFVKAFFRLFLEAAN